MANRIELTRLEKRFSGYHPKDLEFALSRVEARPFIWPAEAWHRARVVQESFEGETLRRNAVIPKWLHELVGSKACASELQRAQTRTHPVTAK